MHLPSDCCEEGVRRVSRKWERCALVVYGFEISSDTVDRNVM